MGNSAVVFPALAMLAVIAVVALNSFKRVPRGVRSTPSGGDRDFQRFDERMARLEQSLDVIAVEMERISESQRFLTRILAEPRASHS